MAPRLHKALILVKLIFWPLPGAWGNRVQVEPDYYATGIQTQIWDYSWGTGPFTTTPLSPPHRYNWPIVPDYTTKRYHTTSVNLDNQHSCDTSVEYAEFNSMADETVTVTVSRSSGWGVGATARWAVPLVESFALSVNYSESNTSTYTSSESEVLTGVVRNGYRVGSCKRRLGFLIITETHRTRGTDMFEGMTRVVGVVRENGGENIFDYTHYLGLNFNRINGSSSWISNLGTDAGPETWIPDCDINCGGTSDGDEDDDGILDENDDDMDGDGITNDHDEDMDGDGIPNSSDPDDDNDGIPDVNDDSSPPDGSDDIDGDGTDNEDDFDVDGDHVPNAFETGPDDDLDGDGVLNKDDGDIDGDGIPNDEDDSPYGRVPTLTVWQDGIWSEVPLY